VHSNRNILPIGCLDMSGADILKQWLRRIDKKDNPIVRENQKTIDQTI